MIIINLMKLNKSIIFYTKNFKNWLLIKIFINKNNVN